MPTTTRTCARGPPSAAAHFFVLTREQDYHDRYTQPDKLAVTGGVEVVWPVPFWYVDAGVAMMLVMLAALEEGPAPASTGSRSTTTPACESCSPFLDDLTIVVGVTVGHPAEDPDRDRASSVFPNAAGRTTTLRRNRWAT